MSSVIAIVEDTIFMFFPQGYSFSWGLNILLLFGCLIMKLLPYQLFQFYLNQQIEHTYFHMKGIYRYKGLDSILKGQSNWENKFSYCSVICSTLKYVNDKMLAVGNRDELFSVGLRGLNWEQTARTKG